MLIQPAQAHRLLTVQAQPTATPKADPYPCAAAVALEGIQQSLQGRLLSFELGFSIAQPLIANAQIGRPQLQSLLFVRVQLSEDNKA